MIEATELSKSYADLRRGEFRALSRLSFTAREGEIFGLLGPNGAGKTTALRILSTVLKPTAGRATVAGYDAATQSSEVRRNIGFMSGNTGIYDRMTAWELVQYYGRLYGIPEDQLQERLDRIFTTLQMNEIRDVLGSKMSTGMKQKVSIARTVAHDPPVLVFDEPTVALDVINALEMRDIIGELRDAGKAIVFSTHIMSEVERLCDRIGIIHGGKLRATGTLDELRELTSRQYLEEIFVRLVED